MGKPSRSPFENNPLRKRLAALRRRLRFVVTVRGVGWLLALVLLAAAGVGVLDWAWHLPALVRAVALVAVLGSGGILAILYLLRPLLGRMDDLTLALRIEDRFPSLNDALASTIQFLEQGERKAQGEAGSTMKDSLAMRREAARRAMQKADGCDFNRIIDTRGLRTAGVAGFIGCAVGAILCLFFPGSVATALARLADPFGAHNWPTATRLELEQYKERIGRNEGFEVRGKVQGVIPDKAVVAYRLDGASVVEHECKIVRAEDGRSGTLTTYIRPGVMTRNFVFQVRANDAVSKWMTVEVAPAPTLAPYEGQASPQVTLFYPAYTELPSVNLPAGTGQINAIAGTVATLRAAANVPLRRAWLEYQPEPATQTRCACLVPFSASNPFTLLTAGAVVQEINGQHPATLYDDGKSFHIRFMPRLSGTYSIHLEDMTELHSQRSYELRVLPDPAPAVTLERPNPLRESLEVLPGARLPLRVVVEDPTFGIRSIWLESRCQDESPRRFMLFDPRGTARSAAAFGLTGNALMTAIGRLAPNQHVIEQPLHLSQLKHADGSSLREGDTVTIRACADDFDNVSVSKQPGVSSEVEIHIVTRSSLELALNREQARIQQDLQEIRQMERDAARKVTEIENRVGQTRKLMLDDQAELARIEQAQQQIRERLEAPGQESLTGRVERVLETLKENEIQRSAVEERLGVLRKELDRLGREQLKQIESALTGARKQAENGGDRTDAPAKALDQEAEKADSQAQKLEKLAADSKRPEADRARLQEEAKALRQQAARLREMSRQAAQDARAKSPEAEARAQERARELEKLAQEREKLARELAENAARDMTGQEREMLRLADEQKDAARSMREQAQGDNARREKTDLKAGLTEVRRRQEEVEKTLSELLKHMEPWSTTREVKSEARAVLEEQRRLTDDVDAMKQGLRGKNLEVLTPEEKARLENATAAQQKLRERMQELTEKMRRLGEERKAADPTTAQELREAVEQIDKGSIPAHMEEAQKQLGQNQLENAGKEQQKALAELQDLVKKMEDRRDAELDRFIKQMKEAEKRLDELADEQDRLHKKMKEAAKIEDENKRKEELQKLAREQKALQEKTRETARELSRLRAERASQSLNQAAQQMEEAVKRLERGEPAGDKQEESLDRLEEARDDVQQARESTEVELAREQLARVADVLKRLKERHERFLAETERLKKEVLEQKGWTRTLVLRGLGDLAEWERGLAEEARTLADRDLASAEIFARQLRRAAESMKQAAEAFDAHGKKVAAKPGDTSAPEVAERLQQQAQRRLQSLLDALKTEDGESVRPSGANRGGSQGRSAGDGIPPMAQLKLLRTMQTEVNEQTKEFSRKHPEPAKLAEAQKKELEGLQREQKMIADLIEEYTRPAPGEGDKK